MSDTLSLEELKSKIIENLKELKIAEEDINSILNTSVFRQLLKITTIKKNSKVFDFKSRILEGANLFVYGNRTYLETAIKLPQLFLSSPSIDLKKNKSRK